MAKFNLNYYDGNDIYNDGNVEEKLLDHYKNGKSLDLYQDDIFYLTTDIRSNILNWYPFSKKDDVLEIGCGCGTLTGMLSEKCGTVTCIEGSKRRAEITYYRHKDKENLEIYAGNFNDIKIDKKFNYIILIGVFEYAKMFFQTENPFDTFLEKIKNLLVSDGKVLLAIENRYGIKYWAGANEDHLSKPYVGLESYDNYPVQTFGKEEFLEMINKKGFKKSKFYYPFPDYKLPNIIYTDERLPKCNEIVDIPIYPYGSTINFNVKQVLSGIIDNRNFGFFSNSFLIEFGTENATLADIIYARNLSYRQKDYKTITIENSNHEIVKMAHNRQSLDHLENLKRNHEAMQKIGIPTCKINRKDNIYQIERIDGMNVAQYIQLLVKQKQWDDVWKELDHFIEYYKKLSTKKIISNPIISEVLKVYPKETWVLKLSLIDGNASNIIRKKNGDYILIDQEWMDERELPMEYLIYYSLSYIWNTCDLLQKKYPISKIYKKYGITKRKQELFCEIEQIYFLKIKNVIDLKTQNILKGCSQFQLNEGKISQSVLYYDIGDGFNENHKIIGEYEKVEDKYLVTFQLPKGVSKVRFDPSITGSQFAYFSDIRINNKEIQYEDYNIQVINGRKSLCSKYPYIVFPFQGNRLNITLKIEKLSKDDINDFMQLGEDYATENKSLKEDIKRLNEIIHEQENRLIQITNSKGWQFLEKIRKIKNK